LQICNFKTYIILVSLKEVANDVCWVNIFATKSLDTYEELLHLCQWWYSPIRMQPLCHRQTSKLD